MEIRILGIDYGEKRVGLALSDPSGRLALPLAVLPNSSRLAEQVAGICRERGVTTVVLGESRDWRGEENPMMKRARAFGARLAALAGLPLVWESEFMSSAAAAREGVPPESLDAAAAALILRSYLERSLKPKT